MIARFYSLVLREPDGAGRKKKAAEAIASGVSYKNIRGRRYYQLVSTPRDVYEVPEGWSRSDIIAWAPMQYDAFFYDGQFTPLIPPKGRRAKTRYAETARCLEAYAANPQTPWISPLPLV